MSWPGPLGRGSGSQSLEPDHQLPTPESTCHLGTVWALRAEFFVCKEKTFACSSRERRVPLTWGLAQGVHSLEEVN